MARAALVSLVKGLDATQTKATNAALEGTTGEKEGPLPETPWGVTLRSSVVLAARSRAKMSETAPLVSPGARLFALLAKTTVWPSPETLGEDDAPLADREGGEGGEARLGNWVGPAPMTRRASAHRSTVKGRDLIAG